jgi:hypothetical protein
MRIIAAEVAITPQNHPEVEVGMLPLDLDLPGPSDMLAAGGVINVRLTLHTSRGDLTFRQPVRLREEEPTEQPEDPDLVNLPRNQYLALLRSVEHPSRDDDLGPGFTGFQARLPRRPSAPSDQAMVVLSLS